MAFRQILTDELDETKETLFLMYVFFIVISLIMINALVRYNIFQYL